MATTTGTFTLKGDDLGNLPSYYDAYVFLIDGQWSNATSASFTPDTFTNVLDQYVTYVNSLGGTMTYSLNGPGTWNAGTDTIVTINISNVMPMGGPELIPYYIVFSTESYNYPVVWSSSVPVEPTLCNSCQFIQLNQCGEDNFYLPLGLPDGNYTAYYTDNTSGVVWEQGTYSAEGGLVMYQWFATAGMFNPYSFYTLTIKDNLGNPVSWTIDSIEYTCATLTFKTTVNVTD